jgi:TnpA family transposase
MPATVRDAPYVLDELCNTTTELPIVEHTTDTHGYTEIIFALFDLVGFQFTPRLRDLGRQRLYTSGTLDIQCYPRLQPYIRQRLRRHRILEVVSLQPAAKYQRPAWRASPWQNSTAHRTLMAS